MKNTLKIKKAISRYKAYKRYKAMVQKDQPESIEYYKFYEMDILRELATLRAESPNSFRVACALDRVILN